jgi:hypothetical protein
MYPRCDHIHHKHPSDVSRGCSVASAEIGAKIVTMLEHIYVYNMAQSMVLLQEPT